MKLNAIQQGLYSIVLLAISASTGQAQENLIDNGSFETPDLIDPPVGFETFNEAPAGFGWSIDPDLTRNSSATTGLLGVDVIDGYWVCQGATDNPDGSAQCLDIDGDSSISQSFPTAPGQEYFVEFHYAHHFLAASSTGILTVQGDAVLLSQNIVHSDALFGRNAKNDMKWQLFSRSFVADSAETTLTIQGLAAQGGLGFAVDNVSVVASEGEVQSDPVVEKTLSFGPKQLDGAALVDVPGTVPGQIRVDYDQAQFFGFDIDISKGDSTSPNTFVLSDGLAPFVVLSADGEAAAEDPGGAMMIGGSCSDSVCDGIKVQADPSTANCTAEALVPGDVNTELDVELAAGTIVVVRLGSDVEPFEVGNACRVSLFVETVRVRGRGEEDDEDEEEDDGLWSDRFEPNAVLQLLNTGGVVTNEWYTLNSGVKAYETRDGQLIKGPVEALALQPVP